MSRHHLNRGVMWGRLLGGLAIAKDAMKEASAGAGLLSEEDRKRFLDVHEMLLGLEQRAWIAQTAASDKTNGAK